MSSIRDVVARGNVQEVEEWIATHKGAEVNKDVLRWAAECDSVEILKEWMEPDSAEERMVVNVALRLAPPMVSDWLVEQGKLKTPVLDKNQVHWRTWMRLLQLDGKHPCYAAKFAEGLRTPEGGYLLWVESFLVRVVENGTREELEWLEREFGSGIWKGVTRSNLLRNPNGDVIERFYDSVEEPAEPGGIWDVLCRWSTPAVAEVVRGRIVCAGYAGPKVQDMYMAMFHGNPAMYRWIEVEYGLVVKSTKKMFLVCCEHGEPDDIRKYWMNTRPALAEGSVTLFARGMWGLVEEMAGTEKPDEKILTKCVRGRAGEVKVLQGIILMGWKGLIQVGRKGEFMRELDRTALLRGYQPWVSDILCEEGIFFTREEILSS